MLLPYWRPLLGTAGCWFLYDIVEYGLKQNDAAIFDAGTDAAYSQCLSSTIIHCLKSYERGAVAPEKGEKVFKERNITNSQPCSCSAEECLRRILHPPLGDTLLDPGTMAPQ